MGTRTDAAESLSLVRKGWIAFVLLTIVNAALIACVQVYARTAYVDHLVEALDDEAIFDQDLRTELLDREEAALPRLSAAVASPGASSRLKIRALTVLGLTQDERAAPAIAGCLADPDPAVRRAAVEGLGLLQLPVGTTGIRSATSDAAPEVRLQAVDALASHFFGDVAADEALAALCALAADPEPQVRDEAARQLRKVLSTVPGGDDHPHRAAARKTLEAAGR